MTFFNNSYIRYIFTMGWVGLSLGCLESANLVLRRGIDFTADSLFHLLLYYYPAGLLMGAISLLIIYPVFKIFNICSKFLIRTAFIFSIIFITFLYLNTRLMNIAFDGFGGGLMTFFISLMTATVAVFLFKLMEKTELMKILAHPCVAIIYLTVMVSSGMIYTSPVKEIPSNESLNEGPELASIDSSFSINQRRPNIIFILADALRADYPGEDFSNLNTPNLKRLANDGVVFTSAISSCSWTLPSVVSILTGYYPETHGLHYIDHPLPENAVTIAELLAGEGYTTAAFVTNPILHPVQGLDRGFQDYYYLDCDYFPPANYFTFNLRLYQFVIDPLAEFLSMRKGVENYYQPAETVADEVVGYLDKYPKQPFFMYIHLFDPHAPYYNHPYEACGYIPEKGQEEMLAVFKKAYLQEIEYMDKSIGYIINRLIDKGLYHNSLIVFTSDHGEEFLDHGNWLHLDNLCDELTRIPLIVKRPRENNPGTKMDNLIRSIDLFPTLANSAGIEISGNLAGVDLFGQRPAEIIALSQYRIPGREINSIRTKNYRYIENLLTMDNRPPRQLFDLRNDPSQLVNIVNKNDSLRDHFAGKLRATIDIAARKADDTHGIHKPNNTALKSKLESLGYILP
ncbi:MAG: sulfatase-like hydrolase/transferase [candidate division Zixibacteria bacterium]|nr:sulfatase-like hydrolase/transferase [candidate division Zixibacteria bacterium]